MALSNILREPRRESMESAVGISLATIPIYADYRFAVWFSDPNISGSGGCPWGLGMVVGLLIVVATAILIGVFAAATHALGNVVCDFLEERGIYLRPRVRNMERKRDREAAAIRAEQQAEWQRRCLAQNQS